MDKISVTLYDLLGYILPGCILLLVLSVIEATFVGSHHLSLSAMTANPALSAVACYFLGAVAHSTGSILKDWRPSFFSDKKSRLDQSILDRAKEMAKGLYGFAGEGDRDLTTLEIYLLADSYVIASGKTVEREVLQAREGFYKASMVAMAALSIAFFFAAIFGGGGGTRTPVQRSVNKSVYERIPQFNLGPSSPTGRILGPQSVRLSSSVDGLEMTSKPVSMTPGTVHTGRERADARLIRQRVRNC